MTSPMATELNEVLFCLYFVAPLDDNKILLNVDEQSVIGEYALLTLLKDGCLERVEFSCVCTSEERGYEGEEAHNRREDPYSCLSRHLCFIDFMAHRQFV